MREPIRWLHQQLGEWVSAEVISAEQAGRIRSLYPEPKAATPWGLILFSGVGAVIAGLGIVLLFAYNWHAIPKFGKLGLVFGVLVAAHAGGLALLLKTDWRRQLGEVLCLLGTMFFGAGIWLVAQVYHIDEHYPNGFLLWGLGALAMAWALRSTAQGLLATVVLTIWAGSESIHFTNAVHAAPLLLVVGLGTLAWWNRSWLLLAVVVAALYAALVSNAWQGSGELAFSAALCFSAFLIGCARLAALEARFLAAPTVLAGFGFTGFLLCTYVLSFQGASEELLRWNPRYGDATPSAHAAIYGWSLAGLAMAGWLALGAVALRRKPELRLRLEAEDWLVPLTVVLYVVLTVARAGEAQLPVAGIFNLIFLAIAAMWMARGCREGRLAPTVLGSLLLVALVTARYFDLFESLALRGLLFLAVGGVLFAEGFFYRRARQEAAQRRAQP